jgi:ribosomal protein S19E (S16A)
MPSERPINGQPTLNAAYKQTDAVDCLEQGGNRRLTSAHSAIPNLIQQTLESMGIVSKISAHHHRRTTLDGMHTPE